MQTVAGLEPIQTPTGLDYKSTALSSLAFDWVFLFLFFYGPPRLRRSRERQAAHGSPFGYLVDVTEPEAGEINPVLCEVLFCPLMGNLCEL